MPNELAHAISLRDKLNAALPYASADDKRIVLSLLAWEPPYTVKQEWLINKLWTRYGARGFEQAQKASDSDTEARDLSISDLIDEKLVPPKGLEAIQEASPTDDNKPLEHTAFSTLVRMMKTRQHDGTVPGIYITGPAGSGKTFGTREAAQCNSLDFYFNGAVSMPHELVGFVDGNGRYHSTPFRQAYENGGAYLFDEVDASDNAALLALNAALANGHGTFPDSPVAVKRHADFVCICTANTWGLGGTADYVGRARLDAAFLNRFPFKIDWQYDERLERHIAKNDSWCDKVLRARASAKANGLKVIISPRDTYAGAALIANGFSMREAAECTYLANLTPDQRRQIGEA